MGSSWRMELNEGRLDTLEGYLRHAVNSLERAIEEVFEYVHDEDQYDNAAHTGGLLERLRIAKDLITSELP